MEHQGQMNKNPSESGGIPRFKRLTFGISRKSRAQIFTNNTRSTTVIRKESGGIIFGYVFSYIVWAEFNYKVIADDVLKIKSFFLRKGPYTRNQKKWNGSNGSNAKYIWNINLNFFLQYARHWAKRRNNSTNHSQLNKRISNWNNQLSPTFLEINIM